MVVNLTSYDIDISRIFGYLAQVRHYLNVPTTVDVDVNFLEEDSMTRLHVRYLGLSGPTDVLSFPALDVSKGLIDSTNLRSEPTLGDVVICPAFLEPHGKDQDNDMALQGLVTHGFLHLLGYDHQTQLDASIMYEKQRELQLHCR